MLLALFLCPCKKDGDGENPPSENRISYAIKCYQYYDYFFRVSARIVNTTLCRVLHLRKAQIVCEARLLCGLRRMAFLLTCTRDICKALHKLCNAAKGCATLFKLVLSCSMTFS